jgi:hypothetical protein
MKNLNRAQRIVEILGTYKHPINLNIHRSFIDWITVINGHSYKFTAETSFNTRGHCSLHINFEREISPGNWTMVQVQSSPRESIKVFSAAVAFVKAVIEEVRPVRKVEFSAYAKEGTRLSLYEKLAQYFQKSLPDSELVIDKTGRGDYTLVKYKIERW